MDYKLTNKYQFNKKDKDKKNRSYLIYFLNNIQILKQKNPFDEKFEIGCQHQTRIYDVYLFNGKIHQTRNKDGKIRNVSFPISKNILNSIGFPNNLKINLSND